MKSQQYLIITTPIDMPPWIGEEFHMVPYLDEEVAGINDF